MSVSQTDVALLYPVRTASTLFVEGAKRTENTTADAEKRRPRRKGIAPEVTCLVDRAGRVLQAASSAEDALIRGCRCDQIDVHDFMHPNCRDSDCSLRQLWLSAWDRVGQQAVQVWHHYDPAYASMLRLSLYSLSRLSGAQGSDGYAVVTIGELPALDNPQACAAGDCTRSSLGTICGSSEASAPSPAKQVTVEAQARFRERLSAGLREKPAVADNPFVGTYIEVDEEIVFCNKRFADIIGVARPAIFGCRFGQFFTFDGGPADERDALTVPGHEASLTIARTNTEPERHVKVVARRTARKLESGLSTVVVGHIIDITDEIRLERTLRASQQELHMLSCQLISAQENERKRIASELHDGIGQSLGAMKFSVETAIEQLSRNTACTECTPLNSLVHSLQNTIEEVRRIAMDLRPSTLDDLGVLATLEWFCREYQNVYSDVRVKAQLVAEEEHIPATLKLVIYRIVQEAMNNIAKHADATQVSIELRDADDGIDLLVRDNGRGFQISDRTPGQSCSAGFGLNTMRERAELAGGSFRVESTESVGTIVAARWPARVVTLLRD